MQRLRSARFLARLVLAWFVLAVGAAVAAPMVQPGGGMQLVCSGGGLQLVPGDGDAGTASFTLDCPLCTPAYAPPPAARSLAPVATGSQPLPQRAAVSAQLAPSWTPPARGPPGHAFA